MKAYRLGVADAVGCDGDVLETVDGIDLAFLAGDLAAAAARNRSDVVNNREVMVEVCSGRTTRGAKRAREQGKIRTLLAKLAIVKGGLSPVANELCARR